MTATQTKLILPVLFSLFAAQIFAETPLERNARGISAGDQKEYEQLLKNDYALMLKQYNGQFFAVIDGKVYDMKKSGEMINGNVKYLTDGLLVIDHGLADIAVKNYTGDATIGKHISLCAIRTGTYDWNGIPLQLWDGGKPYVPPPPTLEQIKASQEAAKIAAQREKQKQFLAQSNVVVWLQPQATNGDASAQYRLAIHYLNGQGCETNKEQAMFWLQKSAAQGDTQASNKLSALKSP